MRTVLTLAIARLRYRPARWLLAAAGVALAVALPVYAQASADAVVARAVAYGVDELDPGQRTLVASISGIAESSGQIEHAGAAATAALARLSGTPARAEMLLHRAADGHGGTYFLGAVDDLATGVRLTSGRLPASCLPERCEVVVLGDGTPDLDPSLGLVIVGRAVRTDPLVLGGDLDPGHDAPILLADGVTAAAQLTSLDEFGRTYAWVAPLDLGRVRSLGVGAYLARSGEVADQLGVAVDGMQLTAPDDVLSTQQSRAQLSTRRFGLLAGTGTALLVGFAAIGAIGLRRDGEALAGLLRRHGAGRVRVAALAGVESLAPVIAGTVAGLAAGAGLAATAAAGDRATAVAAAVRAALPSVGVGVLAALVAIVAFRAWPAAARPSVAWHALEAVVVAGAAIAALALARGTVTAGALGSGTDPLLVALPILVMTCGALAVGRLYPGLAQAAARLLRRRWIAARIGIRGSVRRPLRPVATAAFLAAAFGSTIFAAAYSATLQRGAADQAAYAVPLDARITTGTTLVNPLAVGTTAGYAALVPGGHAYPVLRATASIRISAGSAQAAGIIGVDPAALTGIPAWDREVGASSAAAMASALRTGTPPTPQGIRIPDGTAELSIPASGDADLVALGAFLRTPDGRDVGVPLTYAAGAESAPLPVGAAGATLFAFGLDENAHANTIAQHHFGEGGTATGVVTGTLHLGLPGLPGASWQGWGSAQSHVDASGSDLAIGYAFTGQAIVVRAGAAASDVPIPVLVDPVTAAASSGGRLDLVVDATTAIPARIVAVAPRFPTAGASFIVGDVHAIADALDEREPGTGGVSEVWVSAPPGAAATLATALSRPPYDQLDVDLQAQRRSELAGDPLATGASRLLATEAAAGLAITVLALALLVVAERRDEATELYAWESDGLTPAALRRSMLARAGVVAGVGALGGLFVGLALAALVTRLVAVTAVGSAPVPPLSLSFGAGPSLLAVVASAVLGLAAAGIAAATALREALPARPEESPS